MKLKLTPHLINDMMKMYSDAMVVAVGRQKVINDGRQDDAFLAVLKKCATCRHANEGDTRRESTGDAATLDVLILSLMFGHWICNAQRLSMSNRSPTKVLFC